MRVVSMRQHVNVSMSQHTTRLCPHSHVELDGPTSNLDATTECLSSSPALCSARAAPWLPALCFLSCDESTRKDYRIAVAIRMRDYAGALTCVCRGNHTRFD
jgi:hypothetical protein